ncbi:hypothetical protein GGS23DRAFT_601024 [Durotheca rogersii]|uniref:uncharacterized protein n=1 Tax=Durotheca rogersii TaxID=419775 RepID=UPI00221EC216|nr:uncharacterized protein GGS23DRAFT_601024 [Durotheca rogersii]KAI5856759.1 hypothetical protein GGS23DRAFT_601024 [Durotheca rogersii]
MAEQDWPPSQLISVEKSLENSRFLDVFHGEPSRRVVTQFVRYTVAQPSQNGAGRSVTRDLHSEEPLGVTHAIRLGLASLSAFLQTNVAGPVLDNPEAFETVFLSALEQADTCSEPAAVPTTTRRGGRMLFFRNLCLQSLNVDGVSPYPYIPRIELFCLSRFIFTSGLVLRTQLPEAPSSSPHSLPLHLSWTRLRIHLWHYKLITQPSLGSGSLFTKSGRWTDVPTLQETIEISLREAESSVLAPARATGISGPLWPRESRIQFLLEKAACHILLGDDKKARDALRSATTTSEFSYALSGALGKRTRFQEKDVSQLVVLAKSLTINPASPSQKRGSSVAPVALPLNDDTLLEKIDFHRNHPVDLPSSLPPELQDVDPQNQPQLRPEDHIILLTEATLRDTFSPTDSLTLEEILPFALRVIDDKSTNWQIYTQALLVRSRIELSRSRTVERGVLQMQAVVDQVIADTQGEAGQSRNGIGDDDASVIGSNHAPVVRITRETDCSTSTQNPVSFFPASKPTESAAASERLRYVNALSCPPRWHLESELAHAWTTVGSLVSALEIFKRLRLWAEVALCLAGTTTGAEDPNGRGSRGEDKARAVIRWRLFHRTPSAAGPPGSEASDLDDDAEFDVSTLKVADFYGPERSPPPPNAPRLFCILGDIENDPQHYHRAWNISKQRFSRAQRSLGELHLRKQEWSQARDAYALAVSVNRLSLDMWGRLGDIELRLGHYGDAAEAFQRAISAANSASGGEDARTWNNLGSALLSWYRQAVEENQDLVRNGTSGNSWGTNAGERAEDTGRPTRELLRDSLAAFKRGATLANSNWRIWDNVVTLAASLTPSPNLEDVVLGLRNVIRIRGTEEALDLDILTLLIREVTQTPVPKGEDETDIYEPSRGSIERKVVSLFEDDIVPLITTQSACWSLVCRLRAWKRDWTGALEAAEKAWRTAVGGVGIQLSASSAQGQQRNWLVDENGWDSVVQRTSELVAAYENYGPRVDSIGSRWKGKARSAVRSVMGKAKESWEGDDRWQRLLDMMRDLA